jgi:predicted GTPase
MARRVLIMGAAGRDFHNFNTVYRDDVETEVVAFTATQIPFINDRMYPAELAGPNYPNGIQIHDESELAELITTLDVDDVVFAYSDVSHEYVMHKGSEAMAAGANSARMRPCSMPTFPWCRCVPCARVPARARRRARSPAC